MRTTFHSRADCASHTARLDAIQQRQYREPLGSRSDDLLHAPRADFWTTNPRFARLPVDRWYARPSRPCAYPYATGFDQPFYTAGDWSDLWYHAIYTSYTRMQRPRASLVPSATLRPRVRAVMALVRSRYFGPDSPYVDLSPATTLHTLRYVFRRLQKGIFVRIRNNRLDTFLPFVRHGFTNDYYELLVDRTSATSHALRDTIADAAELAELRAAETRLRAWDEEMDRTDPEDGRAFSPAVREAYRRTLHRLLVLEHRCARRYARAHPVACRTRAGDDPTVSINDMRAEPNRRRWLANNHFFNTSLYFDNPHVAHYKHLLETLVAHRHGLPDFEGVLQPRDFSVLRTRRDPATGETVLLQPYPDVETRANHVQGRVRGGLSPILSHSGRDGYDDIPLPTVDDIEHFEQLFFMGRCDTAYVREQSSHSHDAASTWVAWDDKPHARAVFRGSATGRGNTPSTNQRMRVQQIAQDPAYAAVMDVHLVALNRKPKVFATGQTPDLQPGGLTLVQPRAVERVLGAIHKTRFFLNLSQRAGYKYNLCLDGQTRADRLLSEMATGSVVLLPTADGHRLWVEPFLTPLAWTTDLRDAPPDSLTPALVRRKGYTHVTFNAVEDVGEMVRWLVAHDAVGRAIHANVKAWLFGRNGHYTRTSPATSFLYDYMEGVVRAAAERFACSATRPYRFDLATPRPVSAPHRAASSMIASAKSARGRSRGRGVCGIVVGFRDVSPLPHPLPTNTRPPLTRTTQLYCFLAYLEELFPPSWRRHVVVVEQAHVPGERDAFVAWWKQAFGSARAGATTVSVPAYGARLRGDLARRPDKIPASVRRNIDLVNGNLALALGYASEGAWEASSDAWTCAECFRRTGEQKFNLGALKNAGYEWLRRRHGEALTHVVFTDIDMLPDHELAPYYARVPAANEMIALAHRGTVYDRFRVDDMPPYLLLGLDSSASKHREPSPRRRRRRRHTAGGRLTRRVPLPHHTRQEAVKPRRTQHHKRQAPPHRRTPRHSSPCNDFTASFHPLTLEGRPCVAAWAADPKKFRRFAGACVSFSPALFEAINGYPNTFWGWGGEDDELLQRMRWVTASTAVAVRYTVPPVGRLIDLEIAVPVTFSTKLAYRVKEMQKREQLRRSGREWRTNGVAQVSACAAIAAKSAQREGANAWSSATVVHVQLHDDPVTT